MPVPSDGQLDWAGHRRQIEDLYWNQRKELPEVMETMQYVYGFVATKKMYKMYLKAWGLEKNLKTRESIAMLRIAERRRLANKETHFFRHGQLVEPGKLRRFAKRHSLKLKLIGDGAAAHSADEHVATPPDITYTTPEPDQSSISLPLTPQPYPDPGASEADLAAVGDWPESHDTDSALPVPMFWPSDYTYPNSQAPVTHIHTGAQFVPDAFSGHHGSEKWHDSGKNMGSAFYLPSWQTPADTPCTEYQASGDGTYAYSPIPLLLPQPAHPLASGFDQRGPCISRNHAPIVTHAMLRISNTYDHHTRLTHPVTTIPEAANSVLDHMPLHDAVVSSNVELARALLEDGANPNCAARGGMTPLHYAAYQRNVEMVQLLVDYGASLDTMTDRNRSILFFAVRGPSHLKCSDMLAYRTQKPVGSGTPTDDATMRILGALFDSPSGWVRLRRSFEKADKDGVTPLMVAAEEGFEDTVKLLLRRGAQPDVKDHAGHTALKYAARNNHRRLVRLLLEADPGIVDRDLSHLLKLASRNFTARPMADAAFGKDDQGDDGWDRSHKFTSTLIAEEMVRLCREMDVLDRLLELADQRRKTTVLELLFSAMK
ncbi:ankyrin repeat-containing domain protein [Achaetomium macrosporum]|uniref:Ankyrin repeat-containing domain protein n=1 Tax=Achaetomium macrosporum TaxID=79813 RepID=A0AAN7C906_9PEZI|nr:ankyrin repeat-containing domain protein [Achaetomium macrosporum]